MSLNNTSNGLDNNQSNNNPNQQSQQQNNAQSPINTNDNDNNTTNSNNANQNNTNTSSGEEGVQHQNGHYKDNTGSSNGDSKEDGQYDPSNLIINYIPVSVTEDQLRSLFQPFGVIERVKIVNDKFTGFSLGYGFVKYNSTDAAAAAVTALNGHQLHNKRLKVSVSKPPEREKKTNLYISGLPANWTQTELEQLVQPFGRVLEVRVLYDLNTRKCKGVGFARFETQKSAITAINALTGTTVDGGIMPLIVKYADTTNDKVRKAMANGYSPLNNQQQNGPNLQQQPHHPAQAVYRNMGAGPNNPGAAPNQPTTGYPPAAASPYGFPAQPAQALSQQGFQGMYNPAAAQLVQQQQAALLQQQQHQQQQQNPNNPNGGGHAGANTTNNAGQQEFTGVCLFVYHLPLEATESTLFQLFGNYGVVTSAKVMRDLLTSRSKGFGFVNLMNEQQAQAAINGLNGFQLGSKYLKVAFKK